jgi:trigger factor
MAKQNAPLQKIARKRMVREGDHVVIDFEGFVDGVAFDGGKAEEYVLEIGSGSFIPGFEDQIIGMKYEEEKDITVTFPEQYQAENLKGKEAVFKVKLHEIQEKAEAEINDEFAKQFLPDGEDATLENLKAKISEQITAEAKAKYYREDLKPAYLETLVEKTSFALPSSVVDQEINYALNNKVRTMSEDEIKALQEDPSKVEEMRNELKEDAENSVKATFIVDALAKAEEVDVSDQEVMQVLYFEAMQMGQNPQEVVKQYQDNGYLPAIKMSMIEDKVITKLLDEKLGK